MKNLLKPGHSFSRFFYALTGLAFYFSCTPIVDKETTGTITGIVADRTTGEPVATVSVILSPGGRSTVTGSDGTFQFSDIEAGPYNIDLSKEGYKLESCNAVVAGGKNTELHLLIERIPAVVTADREVLDFGSNEGVSQLSFGIVNSGYVDLSWHSVYDCDWIKETIPGKNVEQVLKYGKTATVVVTIDRTKLAYGQNETNIIIYSDNGRSQIKITATNNNSLPVTNVKEPGSIGTSTAVFNAEILSEGTPKYTRRGFVYSKNAGPSIDDNVVTAEVNGNPEYSANASGLEPGVTYYVKAFAENEKGLSLSSNEISFTTIGGITSVSTMNVSILDVVNGKARFNGKIENAGSPAYSEKGFCWNTSGEPSTSDSKAVVSGSGAGEYSYVCASLQSNTTYYVRAYAIQCGTIYYGTTVSFSTDLSATSVTSSAATEIRSTSATLNGAIAKAGSPAYTEKGFFYAAGANTVDENDTKVVVNGTDEGNFKAVIGNLDYNTRYCFRAYAVQNGKTILGNNLYFNTAYTQASVLTADISGIGYSQMTFNGTITQNGDPVISERGFCYSSSYDRPSVSDNKVKVSGYGNSYSYTLTGLEDATTYYVRAYVIQDGNVYYGATKSAKTGERPAVATGPAANLAQISSLIYWKATLQGAFYDGNPAVTEAGFVYGTYSDPVVGSSSYTKVTATSMTEVSGAYRFTRTINDFGSGKVYYYRAYVKTSLGYTYGEVQSFTTM